MNEPGQSTARALMLELEGELELVASWVVWAVPVGWLPQDVADAAAELARARVFPLDRDRFSKPTRTTDAGEVSGTVGSQGSAGEAG